MHVQPPYNYVPPRLAPVARGQVPAKPPVARGQQPDQPPAPLQMPAPEALGIKLSKNEAPLDWDQLRQQLDRLGASSFQLERQGNGFRFACRLPAGSLEGMGDTEAEAVRSTGTVVEFVDGLPFPSRSEDVGVALSRTI